MSESRVKDIGHFGAPTGWSGSKRRRQRICFLLFRVKIDGLERIALVIAASGAQLQTLQSVKDPIGTQS